MHIFILIPFTQIPNKHMHTARILPPNFSNSQFSEKLHFYAMIINIIYQENRNLEYNYKYDQICNKFYHNLPTYVYCEF